MVLSGLIGDAAVRAGVGANGNKNLALLQTFHNTTNPARILETDKAARLPTSAVYAPQTDT